jgi:stage IV sporulation protein FB
MLLFIALFVYMGASAEASAVDVRERSRTLTVSDAAVTRFEVLSPTSSVEEAVEHLLRTSQHDFPVVDGGGRMRGVLTRDDMIRALRERGPDAPVLEVMRRDIPVVDEGRPLEEALRLMQAGTLPAVGIVARGGRLVGLVTPENVGELMMVQAARPTPRSAPPPPPPAPPPGDSRFVNPWAR